MSRVDNRPTGAGFEPETEPVETAPLGGAGGPGEPGGVCSLDEGAGSPAGDGVDLYEPDALFTPLAGGGGSQAGGATGTAGAAGQAAAGGPAGAAEIGRNLDGIQLDRRQEQITVHNPWDFNRLAPKNAGGKKTEFGELKAAEKQLGKAEKAEASARQALEKAQAQHASNPSDKTAAAVAGAEQKLERATADREKAERAVVKQEGDLRGALKALSPGNAAEIDALDLRGRPFTRDDFTITVGGQAVKLENGVDSYATTDPKGLTGSAAGDSKALVAAAIERSGFSASVKDVLLGTSANEGTFSTINGYDKKDITFGFIQMAGGGPGDTLSNMLDAFKDRHPQAFADTLQRYGIDVETVKGGPQLVVREPDGTVLHGDAAAKKLGTDPKLAGALAASGLNADMQDAQLRFAKDYLDTQRQASITAGGQRVAIDDLITSERGNGILFDRSVHQGIGGARQALADVARDYLQAHPGARLGDEAVRADIEAAYIARVSSNPDLKSRCANIAARTSDARGSYVE